jgi:ribosome-associated translation inhibitor RaiA
VDIIFKGRRTDVQERFRRHASAKLGKIERLDSRANRIDVEVSTERNPRSAPKRKNLLIERPASDFPNAMV